MYMTQNQLVDKVSKSFNEYPLNSWSHGLLLIKVSTFMDVLSLKLAYDVIFDCLLHVIRLFTNSIRSH